MTCCVVLEPRPTVGPEVALTVEIRCIKPSFHGTCHYSNGDKVPEVISGLQRYYTGSFDKARVNPARCSLCRGKIAAFWTTMVQLGSSKAMLKKNVFHTNSEHLLMESTRLVWALGHDDSITSYFCGLLTMPQALCTVCGHCLLCEPSIQLSLPLVGGDSQAYRGQGECSCSGEWLDGPF